MYDFHKTRNNSNQHCFRHDNFRRDQKELLDGIKRKNAFAERQAAMVG